MKSLFIKIKDTYAGLSLPAKASLWFLFCNIMQMGMNVLTTPIFTRIMSQDEYGVTNTYNAWRSILMIFTSLNLSYGVFNNAMVKHEDSKVRDEYVSCMQALYCLITCSYLVFYLICRDWCNSVLNMDTRTVMLLFADLLCYPALLFFTSRSRYEFRYRGLVIVTLVMTILTIAAGIISVLLAKDKAFAKIASGVAVNVVFGGFFLIRQFAKGKKFIIPKFWKFALAFNIPLIPHYLSEMILTQSDRIMIERFESAAATANYSIAYSIVLIMQLVISAISASYVPWAYGCLKKKDYASLKNMGNVLIILVSGCICLVMLFVPEIIYVFAGKDYSGAIYCIPPIAFSIFFIFLYELFSTIEFYCEKSVFVMVASVLAALLNVVLNLIFIQKFGYYAAGYTTLVCYFAYAIGHYFMYKYICKKMLSVNRVFDGKFIALMSLIMFGITLVVNLIYDKMLVRYVLAVILMLVIIIKRDFFMEKFKVMKSKEDNPDTGEEASVDE